MWIIWKIGAVILFKTHMAEKNVWRAQKFCSLDFLYGLLTPVMTLNVEKKNN